MRTQSEIKKNNIRKANLLREAQSRNTRGNMTSRFGLYEQCGTPLDMEGEYMGAPAGTEPMNMMMGDEMDMMDMDMDLDMMMGDEMDMMGDDDVPMNAEMMMFMMEKKNAKPDFLDLDGDGNTTEPMKKAAKDKMDEKSGCGGKRYNEGNCGGKRNYNEEDLDEAITMGGRGQTDWCCDSFRTCCTNPGHPNYNDIHPLGHDYGGKVTDYEKMDHEDRSKFDGRKSRVVGVDSNIKKQRRLSEAAMCYSDNDCQAGEYCNRNGGDLGQGGSGRCRKGGGMSTQDGGGRGVPDYDYIDHEDRDEYDGRKSRVVGVDSNIEKQRMMKESYKAVSATPSKDGWGNNFNNILTEGKQVNEVNSLMNRMKKVIR